MVRDGVEITTTSSPPATYVGANSHRDRDGVSRLRRNQLRERSRFLRNVRTLLASCTIVHKFTDRGRRRVYLTQDPSRELRKDVATANLSWVRTSHSIKADCGTFVASLKYSGNADITEVEGGRKYKMRIRNNWRRSRNIADARSSRPRENRVVALRGKFSYLHFTLSRVACSSTHIRVTNGTHVSEDAPPSFCPRMIDAGVSAKSLTRLCNEGESIISPMASTCVWKTGRSVTQCPVALPDSISTHGRHTDAELDADPYVPVGT